MNKRIVIFLLSLYSLTAFSQYDVFPKLLSNNLNKYLISNYFEKVYLQTDRVTYLASDTLWFKGVLVNAYTHSPDKYGEKILYVDFVDAKNQVVSHELFQLDSGFVKGQIFIPAEAESGNYTLVSYTNWMKNMPSDYFFRKTVNIKSLVDKSIDWKLSHKISRAEKGDSIIVNIDLDKRIKSVDVEVPIGLSIVLNGTIPLRDGSGKFKFFVADSLDISNVTANFSSPGAGHESITLPLSDSKPDIQFLPEGGRMVSEIKGIVAFKAIGFDGLPIEVEGVILNKDKIEVAKFASVHDGMGSFNLKPYFGEKYSAEVYVEGQKYEYMLPDCIERGLAMAVKSVNDTLLVTLRKNYSQVDFATVFAHVRGDNHASYILPLRDSVVVIRIPESTLPTGIVHITTFDRTNQPVAERLVYVDNNDNVNLSLSLTPETYQPKELIDLKLKATDKNNNPVQGSFALAVTDDGQIKLSDDDLNINNYLLFRSDIKGDINKPGWYFIDDNIVRKQSLDLVMLTNGWRRFTWKEIIEKPIAKKVEPLDIGFYIEGEVRRMINNKPVPKGFEVSYSLAQKSGLFIDKTETDDDGKFYFDMPDINGNAKFLLQVKSRFNQPKDTYITYKTNSGTSDVNLLSYNPSFQQPNSSLITSSMASSAVIENDVQTGKVENNTRETEDEFLTMNDGSLFIDEVVIKADRSSTRDVAKAKYGYPDVTLETKQIADVINNKPWYADLWDLLSNDEIPGLRISTFNDAQFLSKGDDYLMIDSNYYVVFKAADNHNGGFRIFIDGEPVKGRSATASIDVQMLGTFDPNRVKAIDFYANPNKMDTYAFDDQLSEDMAESMNESMDEFMNEAAEDEEVSETGMLDTEVEDMAEKMMKMNPSILSITTFDGKGLYYSRNKGIVETTILGFTPLTEYYSPKYYTKPETDVVDNRPLVYWKPDIVTNENGEAEISFFATDSKNGFTATAEGLSFIGMPGTAKQPIIYGFNDDDNVAKEAEVKGENYYTQNVYKNNITGVVKSDKGTIDKLITIYQEDESHYQMASNNGFFAIKTSDLNTSKKLIVSCAGYDDAYINIPADGKKLDIILKEAKLKNITLTSKEKDKIVKSMIKGVYKYYHAKDIGQAFHREDVYVDDDMYLSNNTIFNYTPANASGEFMKSDIQKYLEYEDKTGCPIIYPKANHFETGFYFKTDQLCNRAGFLKPDRIDFYDYEISKTVKYNGVECYVVSFNQKRGVQFSLEQGEIYIRKDNSAILYIKSDLSLIGMEFATAYKYIDKNIMNYDISVDHATIESQYSFNNEALSLRASRSNVGLNIKNHDLTIETSMITTGIIDGKRFKVKNDNIETLKEDGVTETRFYRYPEYFFTYWGNNITLIPNENWLRNLQYLHYTTKYKNTEEEVE